MGRPMMYHYSYQSHGFVALIVLFLLIWPLWRIVGRTGHTPLLSLLFFVPIANVILVWYLAFGRWPALERER